MITNITSPNIEEIKESDVASRFVISPLYPGYGSTLGNSLRRVLLSSLTGSAITSVTFDGVTHEFSTIKGVKEDVIEVILNLKKLRFKTFSDEAVEIELSKKGPGSVTAADFKKTDRLEIINKEQHIATLNEKTELSLRAVVERGRGYWTVDQRAAIIGSKMPLGTISVDSLFSPVTHVSMQVEDTRVDQMTNYNKLILRVETDGSVTPKEAILESIRILRDQYHIVEGSLSGETRPEIRETVVAISKDTDISESGLSARVIKALAAAGIQTVADVLNVQDEALSSLKGLGAKGIKEIQSLKETLKNA